MTQIELDEAGKEVELGRGAFGVVVKGRYRLMPVAIKRLLLQSPEQQAAFLKEMAILRACRGSRYIVPFVGASLQPVGCPSCSHRRSSGHSGRCNVLGFEWSTRLCFRGSRAHITLTLPAAPIHAIEATYSKLSARTHSCCCNRHWCDGDCAPSNAVPHRLLAITASWSGAGAGVEDT